MNFLSQKFPICILLFYFLYPFGVLAQTNTVVCSPSGYTLVSINGIFTDDREAKKNKDKIQDYLSKNYNNQELKIDYVHNPSHLGGLGDLFDVVKQGLFDKEDIGGYDLREMLTDASNKIKTQKVLLVGHSQGNFYANSFYKAVADNAGGIPKESIGVYAVATPSDHVAGNGRYITSDTDKVIAGIVGRLPFKNILKPMDTADLSDSEDSRGHDFSKVYIKYFKKKITSDIYWSLDQLKNNTIQKEDSVCIDPPELTTAHKVQKKVLAIVDPVAERRVENIKSSYEFGLAIGNKVLRLASSLFGSTTRIVRNAGASALALFAGEEEPVVSDQVPVEPPVIISEEIPVEPEVIAPVEIPEEEIKIEPEVPPEVIPPPEIIEEKIQEVPAPPTPPAGSFGGGGGGGTVVVTPDTIAPVISMNGNPSLTLVRNTTYTDPGATALDAVNGIVAVSVVSTVDTAISGSYTVTYTATDTAGNTAIATRTVNVMGIKMYFDAENKISYVGDFVVCDIATSLPVTSSAGNNSGITTFISSSNWQTAFQATPNISMPINMSQRFIFGNPVQANSDCINTTYLNDYSDTFQYTTSSGSSVVASNAKIITSFTIPSLVPSVTGIINHTSRTITLPIPTGTTLTALVPTIAISTGATINPSTSTAQDFNSPVVYTLTAPDASTQQYTASVVPAGTQMNFDVDNKIAYAGNALICNIDNRTVLSNLNNFGMTTFMSSSNWQTAFQATPNSSMTTNTNFRYIFGATPDITSDCTNGTFLRDYSQTFYYTTTSGSSVVHGTHTPPPLSSAKTITAFNFAVLAPAVVGNINETTHTVALTVPFGTSVTALVPTVSISALATVSPATTVAQDFTTPKTYTVTAENGSTQNYVVTVTIGPDPSDITAPSITSYTLNGSASTLTIDPLLNNVTLVLSASENVNWMSIKIEHNTDSTIYKIFQSGVGCVDGTSTCTKTWNGILSSGGLLQDGTFRIKVHIQDASTNDYNAYLSPYVITVDTTD